MMSFQSAIRAYPEPNTHSPHPTTPISLDPVQYYPPFCRHLFHMVSSIHVLSSKFSINPFNMPMDTTPGDASYKQGSCMSAKPTWH